MVNGLKEKNFAGEVTGAQEGRPVESRSVTIMLMMKIRRLKMFPSRGHEEELA